jgi:hypothetical protein
MNKRRPASPEGKEMLDQAMLDKIRAQFVDELQKCLESYGSDWVNKEVTAQIIAHLKEKRPVSFKDRFYGDIFDGILYERGIKNDDETEKYEEIWNAIEQGK